MEIFLYLFVTTVRAILGFIQICMLARVILSLFAAGEGPLGAFVMLITEPVVLPVRKVCEKFGLGDGLPIDIPFLITYVLLSFLTIFL